MRECPLCGAMMKWTVKEHIVRIPGNPSAISRTVREWVCPDCDYYEESDEASV